MTEMNKEEGSLNRRAVDLYLGSSVFFCLFVCFFGAAYFPSTTSSFMLSGGSLSPCSVGRRADRLSIPACRHDTLPAPHSRPPQSAPRLFSERPLLSVRRRSEVKPCWGGRQGQACRHPAVDRGLPAHC